MNETESILSMFPGKRILIIGDVMLDEYLFGAVRRISPEAPVPVVDLQKRIFAPGGAGNTACNIAGLKGEAHLLGIVGADDAGGQLRAALQARGIHVDALFVSAHRTTTKKTRVLAHQQQVVRIDHGDDTVLPVEMQDQIMNWIAERLPRFDACILSDYAKGLVTAELASWLIKMAGAIGKPVVVDPKGNDFSKYRGATLVKPNLHEAGLFLGRELRTAEDVMEAGQKLLVFLECSAVLITCGAAGMSLFEPGMKPVHVPAQAREIFDVTGAGDTVISTLTMALTAGADLQQAAQLASRAAGIIVGRIGTTAIQLVELQQTEVGPAS